MADLLKVECPHCGGSLKLKDRSADGKKVRCPKCQEPFKVELPAEDDFDEFGSMDDELDDFGGSDGDDDGGYEDEDEAPRKKSKGASSKKSSKKKKSKSSVGSKLPLLIAGIVFGSAAVIGLIVVVAMNFGGGSGNRFSMAYLFPEHDVVFRVKLAEVLKAPLLGNVVNSPMFKQAAGGGIPGELQLSDIDSVTIGMKSTEMANKPALGGQPPAMVIVIRTTKPFDLSKDAGKNNLREATYNGKKYFNSNSPMQPGQYSPDTYTCVLATEADLKKIIDQGSSDKRRPEFDFVDPNHQILIVSVPQSADGFKLPATMSGGPGSSLPGAAAMAQFQKTFSESAQGVSFGVNLKEGIDIAGKLSCKDDGGAGTLKGQLDLMLGEGKSQFEKLTALAPKDNADVQQMIQMAQQTISSIAVSQNQKVLEVKLAVPNTLKSVIDKVQSNPLFAMMMAGALSGQSGLGGRPGGIPNPATLPPNFSPGQLPPGQFDPSQLPPGQLPPGFPDPNAAANPPTNPGTTPMPMPMPTPPGK